MRRIRSIDPKHPSHGSVVGRIVAVELPARGSTVPWATPRGTAWGHRRARPARAVPIVKDRPSPRRGSGPLPLAASSKVSWACASAVRLQSVRHHSSSEASPSRNRIRLVLWQARALSDVMIDELVVDDVEARDAVPSPAATSLPSVPKKHVIAIMANVASGDCFPKTHPVSF